MRQAMAVIRDSLHDDVDGLREAMLELDVRRSLDNASPGDSLLLPSEPSESDPHSRSASLTASQHGSRGAELHKAASQDVHAPSGLSQAPLASLNAAAEASERETAAGAANGRGAAAGGAPGGGANASGAAPGAGGACGCSRIGESNDRCGSPPMGRRTQASASTPTTPGLSAAAFGAATSPRLGPRLLELLPPEGNEASELYIKVIAARLVVVRLQLNMLAASTNALVKRLLFPSRSVRCSFWSYTHTEGDISLIIDEDSLVDFPSEATTGSPSCWRAVKLCGRRFAFDETGVVSAMFAPYKERVPLLNISTFSTNVTMVEEMQLDTALGAFELVCKMAEPEEEGEDEADGIYS